MNIKVKVDTIHQLEIINSYLLMEKPDISLSSRRHQIKEKLKGSLNAFKLVLEQGKTQNINISDRTSEPTISQNKFEDLYDLGRKLGEGSNGLVYTCTNKKNRKVYAVKISRGDVELLRISKRSFKILKNLNNPNIIQAKCLFLNEVNEKIHFIMEYCSYPSLGTIHQNLTFNQKKSIIKQLLETLVYVHEEGICHRDIKLQNILYNAQEDKIKLIDFGISKRVCDYKNQMMEMWTSTGTLHYMAPEMLTGKSYDLKVDIWAVGVLMYKLFFNSFPFESEYQSDVIHKIVNSEPQFKDGASILNDFIKHLLSKDIESRLSAWECLRHPWIENDIGKTKSRLGSADDYDILIQIRNRNYSVGMIESPQLKSSKEERIQQLKQLNIFEEKKSYKFRLQIVQ